MYSLWKEVSDQIKKKAEDLNNSIQEMNVNPLTKENEKRYDNETEEGNQNRKPSLGFNEKLNLIKNNKFLSKDLGELQYYNNKFKSGFSSIKKLVGDIYKDSIKNESDISNSNNNMEGEKKKKIYLSNIVPWKKGDIMISKIYRKKYNEGIPIKIPDPNINKEVYKQIHLLNVDKERIYNTDILENYNFMWEKKKEQSQQILQEDHNLSITKNSLVPNYMSEMEFWKSYFFNVDIIYNEIADEIYENKYILLQKSNSNEMSFSILRNESIEIDEPGINSEYKTIKTNYPKETSVYRREFITKDTEDILRTYSTEKEKEEPTLTHHWEKEEVLEIKNNNLDSLNIVKPSLSLEKIELSNEKEIEIENQTFMKKTKINGLSFYIDNDIYSSLHEQTNSFSPLTTVENNKSKEDGSCMKKEQDNETDRDSSIQTKDLDNMKYISENNLKQLGAIEAQDEIQNKKEEIHLEIMKDEINDLNKWENESVNKTDAAHNEDTPVETDLMPEYQMEEEINYVHSQNIEHEVYASFDINRKEPITTEKEKIKETNNFAYDSSVCNTETIQISLDKEMHMNLNRNDKIEMNNVNNNIIKDIPDSNSIQTNRIHTNIWNHSNAFTEKKEEDLFDMKDSVESFLDNVQNKKTPQEFQIQDSYSNKENYRKEFVREPKKEEIKKEISNEDMFFDLMDNSTGIVENTINEANKNTKENNNITENEINSIKKSTNALNNISELNINDINLDDINFEDALEFDFDSNNFNEEELKQFEKDLLET